MLTSFDACNWLAATAQREGVEHIKVFHFADLFYVAVVFSEDPPNKPPTEASGTSLHQAIAKCVLLLNERLGETQAGTD